MDFQGALKLHTVEKLRFKLATKNCFVTFDAVKLSVTNCEVRILSTALLEDGEPSPDQKTFHASQVLTIVAILTPNDQNLSASQRIGLRLES